MGHYEMMDELRMWFRANAARLKAPPLSARLRRSETEDETLTTPLYSASFDLESGNFIAAFGVWATGDLSVIIMDKKTKKEVVIDDRRIEKAVDIGAIFDHYCHQIISGGPFSKYQYEATAADG